MSFEIDQYIQDERRTLLEHPLFANIATLDDVRLLMEVHVFAVWDFMTLLKRIQRDLTCVELPWLAPKHITAARLINEIVIGEETDERPGGGFISHMELYVNAMEEIGANTAPFRNFLTQLGNGAPLGQALAAPDIPLPAKIFVSQTLDVALYGTTEQALAYFFFGREDIIPDMFGRLLENWSVSEDSVPMLTYYLKRHIEMDGDDHGPAAKRIIAAIITEPAQQTQLVNSARSAINARIGLWDGVQHLLAERLPTPELQHQYQAELG
ncbi:MULTISPECIES: DUF3050 domain-containing protein [Pseudomonas]|uniref:DUF3050 domain-containing protein n=1 Tax=Pseudomonas donghuensis TaxID=1163398 RepID=A0AAP0XCM4_9PSED|nr:MULTISPECIES: DUF3050 domain-containing protein [Pseudomonas]MDF9894819.1 hypothetical protein [Pseudomonas vranovensis]KDN97937.1 DUF3050 domain-containing protein [Pseudomonas donghuensis]MBF4208458.1 DUF3050 domain-containing protein [Pseudomonas donghuensis]MBS7597284.1 DUF3050 domain-containing protein [Pseudomonas sp. RC2C2]MCP6692999.1 DUF3050 domain-containing protein [Pseudomonas donghuensis]